MIEWARAVSPVKPRFEPAMERAYRAMRNRRGAVTNVLACVTIAVVYDAYLLTDVDLIPDVLDLSMILRLAVMTPLFLIYPLAQSFILRRDPASALPGKLAVVLAVMAFSSVMVLQTATRSPTAAEYFTGGLGMMVAFNIIRSGSLADHLVGTVAMCAIFTFAMTKVTVVYPATKADAVLSLYACSAILMVGAYRSERMQRSGFLAEAEEQRRSEHLVALVHEIRGTLAGVLLNATALGHKDESPGRQAESLNRIRLGGERISGMLQDVLDLEQLTAGSAVAHFTECDLVAVIRDAVGIVETEAASYGIAIARRPSAGTMPITTDAPKLRHVLVNLLRNAVRFTPRGGTVEIGVVAAGGRHAIAVEDHGVGIGSAKLADLYTRFSHVGEPLNGTRGSGLGLPICRELTRVIGGELTITSVPGTGTVATVTLPG